MKIKVRIFEIEDDPYSSHELWCSATLRDGREYELGPLSLSRDLPLDEAFAKASIAVCKSFTRMDNRLACH
jgi:hypothetical protein